MRQKLLPVGSGVLDCNLDIILFFDPGRRAFHCACPGLFSFGLSALHVFIGNQIGSLCRHRRHGHGAAAVAMKEKGFAVTGSDQNVYPPMSTFLAERKIGVMNGYAEQNLAHKPDLVVIGNAISRGNPEAEFVLDHKLRYCSLAALLAEFFIRGKRSIVVTGTHGKTTTTSLLTWVFEHNGLNPSYLIGGIPNNLGQGARFTDSEWFIIEGDEYDTAFFDKRSKFIHYQPEIGIVNNLEFDHADIFENLDAIKKTFSHFIRLIPRNGLLLGNGDERISRRC
jgi:UDP-N-acetylmuramate: L-alanyl-gamma-D-glutamyl-meso-diaminopimelate ligase